MKEKELRMGVHTYLGFFKEIGDFLAFCIDSSSSLSALPKQDKQQPFWRYLIYSKLVAFHSCDSFEVEGEAYVNILGW